MKKGFSIHIGVDYVDATYYNNDYRLPTCNQDAKDMHSLAIKTGYSVSELFLNEEATSKNIINKIKHYSNILNEEDILLITYSGHGSKIGNTETWNLYDRMLLDKELKAIWPSFAKNSRILVVSDSCYSGDIIREITLPYIAKGNNNGEKIYNQYKENYKSLLNLNIQTLPKAQVKLFASSSENEKSYILKDSKNSLFTEALLSFWKDENYWENGVFCGNYKWLKKMISEYTQNKLAEHNISQTTTILNISTSSTFNNQTAFII